MSWFEKRSPQPTVSRAEALGMVPVRNTEVEETPLDGGLIRLAYPLAVKPWFGRLADKVGLWDGRPMIKQLELDEMGSFVWQRIDGRRSVRAIAQALVEEYEVQPREAELSVTAFLKTLGQRGIIGLR
ncbi:PqqD family peptide modification chaperone [Pseudodesulfovibrio cashew]|uniref:PqqD family peptide modification chaperone n=1 Tax=Pseudodesulfovibrio cashew TaxID=2678688 RepID=A0A6I6JAK3_9BACT|nr:PqqD family protein [Pseudodesulfovibrio cashew]QGY39091.1 PqqD family peptide modification chaperone [Pseudodesulfovibrio cashew]